MKLLAKVAVWLLVGFGLLVLLAFFSPFVEAGAALIGSALLGWFSFLTRVLPGVTIKWSGVGMVMLCSILIVVGIHSFCAWMFGHAVTVWNNGAASKWRWSWTGSLYLAVWLLFAAIMGAVGVAHQVGWFLRSNEPTFKRRTSEGLSRNELYRYGNILAAVAKEAKWNIDDTRWMFFGTVANAAEYLHVVLLNGTNGEMAAGAIFHRDPGVRAKTGFVFVSPGTDGEIKPIGDLPAVLLRYQSRTNSTAGSAGR